MSKLNAILFNNQNTENHHSLIGMLKVYYPYFFMVAILICVLFIVVFTEITESLGVPEGNVWNQVPITLVCLLFGIPLLKIHWKEPMKRDSSFFEKKLGEEILKINQICQEKGEPLRFFMPEGIEINVEVKYPSDKTN